MRLQRNAPADRKRCIAFLAGTHFLDKQTAPELAAKYRLSLDVAEYELRLATQRRALTNPI